jgi:hypothetical protein
MSRRKVGIHLTVSGGERDTKNHSWWGEIKITKNRKQIGFTGFTISDIQIYIDYHNVEAEFQRKGYGSMMIDVIKGLAIFSKKPIILYSLENSVKYYKKMGFYSCLDETIKNKIMFEGENPNPDDRDMVWIPETLNTRKKILISV